MHRLLRSPASLRSPAALRSASSSAHLPPISSFHTLSSSSLLRPSSLAPLPRPSPFSLPSRSFSLFNPTTSSAFSPLNPFSSSSPSSSSSSSLTSPVDVINGVHYPTGYLVLEDGTRLQGQSFGDFRSVAGEVVFNTGMVGYTESLTDPSYRGQILVMTYPMIGNYGVPGESRDQWGMLEHFESDRIHARGLIVQDYCDLHSHYLANRSLGDWLKRNNIPALFGIDTRALTKKIRDNTKKISDKSSLLGKIIADTDVDFDDPNTQNLVEHVSATGAKTYGSGDLRLMMLDVGTKNSIIRRLLQRGVQVTVVPWNYDFVGQLDKFDGLLISNGPGDPSTPKQVTESLRRLIQQANPKPVYGICLGHQLIAEAAGAHTYKMRYGHRGQNQPCIDVTDNRVYITSQNHGYAVDNTTYGPEWEPYFINANDMTSEGIKHKTKPIFTTQFHPEGAGGPEDTGYLFDRFIATCREWKKNGTATYSPSGQVVQTNVSRAQEEAAAKPSISIGASLVKRGHIKAAISNATVKTVAHQPAPSTPSPVKKVLVLGSGGLQIGQAGEFDYSGSQAIKALKEEHIQTILINPNIATVQTAKGLADKVYFTPVTPDFVESLIEKERPDGILLQFGGQTALNCGIALDAAGVLEKYGVKVLGTSVETIIATEDRDIFKNKLTEIGEPIARSTACTSVEDAVYAAQKIGFPVIARAAFSLGGLGSGFAVDEEELRALCAKALSASPQVLIERSMKGWKEVEYEVVRDGMDNCVTVCNMENFDPLGIHTGDSIVVAPSQTLSDFDYHMLRKSSIKIVRHLGIVGECNVQYALHPTSNQYCVIEVNPRLSRSSALASKATGYPLAFVAAKIALGKSLSEIKNSITQITAACFEPSLDYCVVKIPRWDLKKFSRANPKLGSGMKSVGEVMGIGRTFEEAFQKALRMVQGGSNSQGFTAFPSDAVSKLSKEELDELLVNATDQRVYVLAEAFRRGYTIEQLFSLTYIDRWFLHKCHRLHKIGTALQTGKYTLPEQVPVDLLRFAKKNGFSDEMIAQHLNKEKGLRITANDVRTTRKAAGIVPVTKQIDTLAAEWPARTNYLYTTYNGSENDVVFNEHGVMVLGAGNYSIGNSVEFDYTAVSTIRTLRALGKRTVTVNYNPETVSTDYDESDRLYFEELTLERVLDITEQERPEGVVVSVGGQIPNNLAVKLKAHHVPILGTDPDDIDRAEDRGKFSAIMDEIGVKQPAWSSLTSETAAYSFADEVGYPVLVRPSYVLSGAAMKVVRDKETLAGFLQNAKEVSKDYPVVISKFIEGAKEVDFDGVAQRGHLLVWAVSEHVEQAGVHSGDATLMLPAQNVSKEMQERVVDIGRKVAKALHIHGPYNAQFILTPDDDILIIETNIRASRSLPFVSKVLDVDFIALATRIMVGGTSGYMGDKSVINPAFTPDPESIAVDLSRLNFVAVKVPQFSFSRLGGADPVTGVEMTSTGEVACYGRTKEEAFLLGLLASNHKLPQKKVLVMSGDDRTKEAFLPSAKQLVDMGYELYALPGTASYFKQHGVPHVEAALNKQGMQAGVGTVNAQELLSKRQVDYVFAFPVTSRAVGSASARVEDEGEALYRLRRQAVDFSIPLCNNVQVANMMVQALHQVTELSVQGSDQFVHSIRPEGGDVRV